MGCTIASHLAQPFHYSHVLYSYTTAIIMYSCRVLIKFFNPHASACREAYVVHCLHSPGGRDAAASLSSSRIILHQTNDDVNSQCVTSPLLDHPSPEIIGIKSSLIALKFVQSAEDLTVLSDLHTKRPTTGSTTYNGYSMMTCSEYEQTENHALFTLLFARRLIPS